MKNWIGLSLMFAVLLVASGCTSASSASPAGSISPEIPRPEGGHRGDK